MPEERGVDPREAAPGPVLTARLEIVPPPSQALAVQEPDRNLAISPDGRYVVYLSGNPSQLVLRPIDRREGQVIAGTSGARYPFFSPDGRWIAFFDGLWLKRVAVAGGPVLTICESEIPRGASWGDDGHIVFATRSRMLRVAWDGGEPVELTKPDPAAGESGHWHLSVLPGGQRVLFTIVPAEPTATPHVAVLDRSSGRIKRLVPGSQPLYLETGHLVFAAAGRLWAVRFDASRLELAGEPTPVVEGVRMSYGGVANYAVSRTGSLVYMPQPAASGLNRWCGSTATDGRHPSMRHLDRICLPACHPMARERPSLSSIGGSSRLASWTSRPGLC